MAQEKITILRVRKSTRNRLRKFALARRESYDEIISRLLGEEEGETRDKDELQKIKQKLLEKGISKDLVNLVGIIPKKLSLEDEREAVRRAIMRKYAVR